MVIATESGIGVTDSNFDRICFIKFVLNSLKNAYASSSSYGLNSKQTVISCITWQPVQVQENSEFKTNLKRLRNQQIFLSVIITNKHYFQIPRSEQNYVYRFAYSIDVIKKMSSPAGFEILPLRLIRATLDRSVTENLTVQHASITILKNANTFSDLLESPYLLIFNSRNANKVIPKESRVFFVLFFYPTLFHTPISYLRIPMF